jgi:hypothetical protein
LFYGIALVCPFVGLHSFRGRAGGSGDPWRPALMAFLEGRNQHGCAAATATDVKIVSVVSSLPESPFFSDCLRLDGLER